MRRVDRTRSPFADARRQRLTCESFGVAHLPHDRPSVHLAGKLVERGKGVEEEAEDGVSAVSEERADDHVRDEDYTACVSRLAQSLRRRSERTCLE